MDFTALILAAGQGTRMKSKIPKVLHKVAGNPMLHHVLDILEEALVKNIIVVLGHEADLVEETLSEQYQIVYQKEQLGTGHAVLQAAEKLHNSGDEVLVLCGDTPLLKSDTIQNLIACHKKNKATITILTAETENPTGYGRIIRDSSGVKAIIEEKDASELEKNVKEINTGTYCFDRKFLINYLSKLQPNNAQGEYYLTDLVKIAVENNLTVEAFVLDDIQESMGINNRIQLAEAEKVLRKRILEKLMLEGVSIIDPQNTYIDKKVRIGQDTIIYPGTQLEGNTVIGSGCLIGPDVRIIDSDLGNGIEVQKSVIVESRLENACKIGPFAYLRPGSVLAEKVKVGDFVEIKKSTIGKESKVPHLSYIGDSLIGEKVNIGCGTITCNYDGKEKHQTIIKDEAFIGSNTNLVAPVTVGKSAVVGAGSTITKEVPDHALGIGRGKQKNILNWQKEKKD